MNMNIYGEDHSNQRIVSDGKEKSYKNFICNICTAVLLIAGASVAAMYSWSGRHKYNFYADSDGDNNYGVLRIGSDHEEQRQKKSFCGAEYRSGCVRVCRDGLQRISDRMHGMDKYYPAAS